MKTDAQIQTDVIQELNCDPSVTHEHIGVAVCDGIVTLAGSVPTCIEKINAEKAVRRVGGVKAIVEKIDVKIPGSFLKDDQDIARAIVDQLRWYVQVPDVVKASVEKGWVELTGEVEWEFQRITAENVIRGLAGVCGVLNKIGIKPKAVHSYEIKGKIEQALKRAAKREAKNLTIDVQGSRVTLSGKVRSIGDLTAVRRAVWSAPGVTFVDDDNLRVA